MFKSTDLSKFQFFSGNPVDRTFPTNQKRDEDFLLQCIKESSSRFLAVSYQSPSKVTILCCKNELYSSKYDIKFLDLSEILTITSSSNAQELMESYLVTLLGCVNTNTAFQMHILSVSCNSESKATSLDPDMLTFHDGRTLLTSVLDMHELSLAGQALAMSSWHHANLYDGRTGNRTIAVDCGMRRRDKINKSISKLYPRIDPVAIACVISSDGTKCLLGKLKHRQDNFYSCLSGFIEPCETVEEAVQREIFEESGITISKVNIMFTQPWPIGRTGGCELMIGCVAQATDSEINVNVDELADAKWFTVEECKQLVKDSILIHVKHDKNSSIHIPGPYAISHHLIKLFIEDKQLNKLQDKETKETQKIDTEIHPNLKASSIEKATLIIPPHWVIIAFVSGLTLGYLSFKLSSKA